jgi:prophage tail gpP-like protein
MTHIVLDIVCIRMQTSLQVTVMKSSLHHPSSSFTLQVHIQVRQSGFTSTNSGGSLVVKTLHQCVLQTQARRVTVHCETNVRFSLGAPKR